MDSHYENITKLLGLTQGIRVTIMNHIKAERGREKGEREGGRKREGRSERERERERVCVYQLAQTHT